MNELKTLSSHFRFGDNWRSFVEGVDAASIENAVASLRTLFPNDELAGASVLDIGCGSGLSMLSAASLGAGSVQGIDIDPASVEATRRLLGQHLDTDRWSARELSIFDASPDVLGTFDVVHSWGVLHHTGDMWTAIRQAAALVAPNGVFALALYRKTPLCGLWRIEKRFYTNASPRVQAAVRSVYRRIFSLGLRMTGRDLATYIADYASTRGMDWEHDVHDWLGGYPYESVTPQELLAFVGPLGFEPVRVIEKRANIGGILGTHCDEFVFRKRNAD